MAGILDKALLINLLVFTGSSSIATACAGSLALLDAGITSFNR